MFRSDTHQAVAAIPARRRRLAIVAVTLLLLWQFASATHAANVAAHADGAACDICVGLGGGHALAPTPGPLLRLAAPGVTQLLVLHDRLPVRVRTATYHGRAPPPALSRAFN